MNISLISILERTPKGVFLYSDNCIGTMDKMKILDYYKVNNF